MNAEQFLADKLRQFSVVDYACVKWVYFFVGLLIFTCYPAFSNLNAWVYLCLFLVAAFPLWLHFFSFEASLLDKYRLFLKTNTPSNQVLLFLSMFFFALMLGVLFPVLVSFAWWGYLIIIALLAIKPLSVTWFW